MFPKYWHEPLYWDHFLVDTFLSSDVARILSGPGLDWTGLPEGVGAMEYNKIVLGRGVRESTPVKFGFDTTK